MKQRQRKNKGRKIISKFGNIMLTIITLPVDFATDMLAYAGELFTDLSTLIIIAIGLPVAFWVISKAIGLFKMRSRA